MEPINTQYRDPEELRKISRITTLLIALGAIAFIGLGLAAGAAT